MNKIAQEKTTLALRCGIPVDMCKCGEPLKGHSFSSGHNPTPLADMRDITRSPGDWFALKFDGDNYHTITMKEATDQVIAITDGNQGDWDEGNANLLAAAPELLEACQCFALWLQREDAGLPGGIDRSTPEGEAAWRVWWDENLRLCRESATKVRAALAKATA